MKRPTQDDISNGWMESNEKSGSIGTWFAAVHWLLSLQPDQPEEDIEPEQYKLSLPDQQQWQEMDIDEKDGYRTDEWLAWRERQKSKTK